MKQNKPVKTRMTVIGQGGGENPPILKVTTQGPASVKALNPLLALIIEAILPILLAKVQEWLSKNKVTPK